MNLKVIKTDDFNSLLFPAGINSLDEFVEKVLTVSDGFIKMQMLSDDAGTEPFYLKEDIKDIYVNFNNVSTLTEEEAIILSVNEFEQNLKPFVDEICQGCMLEGNPETGCDKIINKRDKIDIIEGECFLYQDADDFEDDDYLIEDNPFDIKLESQPGKIFKFRKKDQDNEDD